MQKNILIVIDQAVNQCLDMDLSKFNQLEIVIGASQKTVLRSGLSCWSTTLIVLKVP